MYYKVHVKKGNMNLCGFCEKEGLRELVTYLTSKAILCGDLEVTTALTVTPIKTTEELHEHLDEIAHIAAQQTMYKLIKDTFEKMGASEPGLN